MNSGLSDLIQVQCPVCYYTLAHDFFCGDAQPLATLGWAKSAEEARAMTAFPLDYVQCPQCTHVWNRSFSYEAIPYQENPNRMFNRGVNWQGHLRETRDLAITRLPSNPTVIDIGCGEGHFVRGISEALGGKGRFFGFDPNSTKESGVGVEFRARYFDPLVDTLEFAPDLLVMRHVLEHLTDPAAFIDRLAWAGAQVGKPVFFFAETPCIDNVLDSRRLVDFFYEHPSQFTTESFGRLINRGGNVRALDHGYDHEVVYGLVELGVPESYRATALGAVEFYRRAINSRQTIRGQIRALVESGKKLAIWGGTGKAAAFMHFFDVTEEEVPLVVDSDRDKVGTYVPKTGQLIQYRDALKGAAVDVVIIPSQWRAKDIVLEMERESIHVDEVLIEHDASLVSFSSMKS